VNNNNNNNNIASRGWLSTSGNRILAPGGEVWVGRGTNLHDTRSCGVTTEEGAPLTDNAEGLAEVKRRIDTLTGEWKVNFIRLALENRRTQDNYLNDANYRTLVKEIVDHIGTKPGVYVLVSLWMDPNFEAKGLPSASTNAILEQLARDFYNYDYVMFGVSNEPENLDRNQDPEVWAKMNQAVAAIRAVEESLGSNRHLIAVQGTREWARYLDYYVTHPITAGGGVNVVYETHVYNPSNEYETLFLSPGKTLPVVIGEFGPDEDHKASLADVQILMDQAKAAKIPHLAWTFHQFCPPNLIGAKPGMTWSQNTEGDGLGIPLIANDFGTLVKDNLAKP
jgi:Cellulase (glycosyl hydrolase family 5).